MAEKTVLVWEPSKKADPSADLIAKYQGTKKALSLNDQEFTFELISGRGRDVGVTPIDSLIESAEWRDEGAAGQINVMPILQGTATLRQPHPDQHGAKIDIEDGYRIRCRLRMNNRSEPLWDMRIRKPVLSLADGALTVELADDLWLVGQSRDTFRYRKGKRKRKKGWRYDEIVQDICRQYRIPAGTMVAGRRWFTAFEEKGVSPLEAIRKAVEKEAAYTGVPLVIGWRWIEKKRTFGLHITPLRRNAVLYTLEHQITNGTVETNRHGDMATEVTGRGFVKVKKRRRKRSVTRAEKDAVDQYGYIHKNKTFKGTFDSAEELEDRTKRYLAKRLEPKRKLELSHPGIAVVRRGDAIRVEIPEEGFEGADGLMFVQAVRHSIRSGEYTMDLTMSFADPMDPDKLRRMKEKALRTRKRAERAARAVGRTAAEAA